VVLEHVARASEDTFKALSEEGILPLQQDHRFVNAIDQESLSSSGMKSAVATPKLVLKTITALMNDTLLGFIEILLPNTTQHFRGVNAPSVVHGDCAL
jgi:hypothetical protein